MYNFFFNKSDTIDNVAAAYSSPGIDTYFKGTTRASLITKL